MPLKIIKRKGSPFWYVRGTVKSISIFESTGFPHADKKRPSANAEKYRASREQELESVSLGGKKDKASFSDAVELYLSNGGSPRHLGKIVEELGPIRLQDFDQQIIVNAAKRIFPNSSAASLNRQFFTPFIAVWNCASVGQNALCNQVKWERPYLGGTKSLQRPLTYEDVVKFINCCPPHMAKVMLFLFYTGVRPIEAIELQADNVFLEEKWAVLVNTKNGRNRGGVRGIPLHSCLLEMLSDATRQGGAVFRNHLGKEYASRRVFNNQGRIITQGGGQFKHAIATARKLSGIDLTPYTARHTVSNFLARNATVYEKDQILGHSPENKMSAHYVHVEKDELVKAINKLPDPVLLGLDLCKIRTIEK